MEEVSDMSWTDALPAIGTFLGGPAGTLAGSAIAWLADKLGASEKTVEGIKQTLAGMSAEQLLEAKKIDYDFQKFCKEHDIKLQLAQIDVNKEEAKSQSLFVAGWRPAAGWMCVFGLGYAAVVEPMLRFVAAIIFGYKGTFPVLDVMLLGEILFGLLGLGVYRTFERVKGVVPPQS